MVILCLAAITGEDARAQSFSPYTLETIKRIVDANNDGICGIYECDQNTDQNAYLLACIKTRGLYSLIYMDSSPKMPWWKMGDTKATLMSTNTSGLYRADWYMANKTVNSNCHIYFDGNCMRVSLNGDETYYAKKYPSASYSGGGYGSKQGYDNSAPEEWSGSGFALNNGYIVTNYHVVEDAKTITVQGVKGSFATAYMAEVVATDKYNDLAIIKIANSRFSGFGAIPYRVKTSTSEVGEDVFVLGYPMTSTMGDEIKLTTGVISSKTGFQGDVSLYQISAPIQPGNSGGPLFDGSGNLVGIVSAKHKGAENVGYAIKTSYLNNLIEAALPTSILPTKNTVSTLPLTGKVKSVKNFVFMIKCSSAATSSLAYKSGDSNTTNSGSCRTINHPTVARRADDGRLQVEYVEIKPNETVLTFSYNNISANRLHAYGWMNMDRNCHIIANGIQYKLTRAEGIKIAPDKTEFSFAGETKTFKLYFPAISTHTTTIDFVESASSNWQLYEIDLTDGHTPATLPSSNNPFTDKSTDRVIHTPRVTKRSDSSKLHLASVKIKDYETVLTFEFSGSAGSWIQIDPYCYIIANGKKHYFIWANGIAKSPDKTYFTSKEIQTKRFELHFEAIPYNTEYIDFVENASSTWQLYGIQLK